MNARYEVERQESQYHIERYVPSGNSHTTKVSNPLALNVLTYFYQLSVREIFVAAVCRYDEEIPQRYNIYLLCEVCWYKV